MCKGQADVHAKMESGVMIGVKCSININFDVYRFGFKFTQMVKTSADKSKVSADRSNCLLLEFLNQLSHPWQTLAECIMWTNNSNHTMYFYCYFTFNIPQSVCQLWIFLWKIFILHKFPEGGHTVISLHGHKQPLVSTYGHIERAMSS